MAVKFNSFGIKNNDANIVNNTNVIANNANPPPLQFRLINSNSLEALLPNKELVNVSAEEKSIKQNILF